MTVLVLEYGPFDQGEDSVLVPGAYNPFPYLKQTLLSVPQPGLNNVPEFIPVGSVVGGGSTVNAMFFLRTTSEDFDFYGICICLYLYLVLAFPISPIHLS